MFLRIFSCAIQRRRENGFAIAPILYLLGLIGVGAGVLFSGYSQILRSNQTMSNSLAVKNDLQGTATTLAASSWLSTDQALLCPPLIGSNSPSTPSTTCSASTSAITVGTSFASATAANLPNNYASVSSAGSPVEVGVFKAGAGEKVLDAWGHYYIYCRWENAVGANNALMVISAGANGKIETTCGATTAGGDDMFVVWTTAVTQNHAAVWQTTTSGTAVTGTQFGATGSQVSIDTSGDITTSGNLTINSTGRATIGTGGMTVSGSTSLGGALSGTTGTFSGALSATSGTFSGALTAASAAITGLLTAGSSTLSSATITNDASIGGALGVTGATTLGNLTAGSSTLSSATVTGAANFGSTIKTSTGAISIGTSVVATGSSSPLLTIGKGVGSPAVYPFTVDQFGAVNGSSFTGSLNGSQAGGSVSATTLAASGAATLSSTLAVTGATTLTGALGGSSAIFTGNVTAATFTGTMTLGGGSGVTLSGVVPIANGGTGQTSAGGAWSALLAGASANSISGAYLVNNSVTTGQLSTTGVSPGTYSSVTVGADGRITSGTSSSSTALQIADGSGDSVTVGTGGITYTIGSSTVGYWTPNGLMIGSSRTALDKLDVYGGMAVGTSYAGTTSAPTNGLIVQGQMAVGTSTANGALNVNGTVTATNFSGSGAGLTSIGTGAISGTVGTGSGGTGTNTVFTQGSVVYSGASGVYSQDNSNFFYDATNHRLGLGTASPTSTLNVKGTTAFQFGTDYTTTGNQSDVNLGSTSAVRYNGSAAATFYGILAGQNGQIIDLHNASSYNLTLSNSSAAELTAANQILTGTGNDLTLQSNSSVILQYDTSATKWRIIGGSGGGGSGLAGQVGYFQTTGSTVVGTSTINIIGGQVGIGTASPSAMLHVNGTVHLTGVAGGLGSSSGSGLVGGSTTQVQFNNAGVFAGDSNFVWDNTSKFLGIGTATPYTPLHVVGNIQSVNDNAWSAISDYTYGTSYYGTFRGQKARGTLASPTAVQSGDTIVYFDGYGYDGTGFNTPAAGIQIAASSTWTGTASSRNGYMALYTTGSGTPTERMRIDSSGNVGIGTATPLNTLDVYSGGIHIGNSTPSSTTNALYAIGTSLMWNGSSVGSGGSGGSPVGSFGGMYSVSNQGITNATNPYTGATTCPSGFTAKTLTAFNANNSSSGTADQFYYSFCYQTGGAGGAAASSNGTIQFNSSGVLAGNTNLFWDNTNSRVGIGTTTPSTALHLFNSSSIPYITLQTGGAGTTGGLQILNSANAVISGLTTSSSGEVRLNATASYFPSFYSNGNEAMRITTAGNVAIGTTTASTALTVNGTATATTFSGSGASLTGIGTAGLTGITGTPSSTTYLRGDGTWATAGSALTGGTTNYVPLWTSATTIGTANIYQSGSNVGIGTTTPSFGLELGGTSTASKSIGVNASQVLYLPDQTTYQYSLFIGGGGTTVAHSTGTEGQLNTVVGMRTGNLFTSGTEDTLIGNRAGFNGSTLNYATYVGYQAGYRDHTSTYNTGVGLNALFDCSQGNNNTAIGSNSGGTGVSGTCTGTNNFFGGVNTGYNMTTGNYNVFLGDQSGYNATIGSYNIQIGSYGGVGGITTGSNNILVGEDVRPPSQTTSNQLNIGNLIYGTGLGTGSTLSTGNVGIGTTSPTNTLDIFGGLTVRRTGTAASGYSSVVYNSTDGATAGEIGFTKFGSTASSYGPYAANNIGVNAYGSNVLFGTESAHPIILYTSNSERLRIDSSGNVGIGTTSPQAVLDISTATSGNLRLSTTAANAGTPSLQFYDYWNSGTTTPGYIASSWYGGTVNGVTFHGMLFQSPRDVSGGGFVFASQAGTVRMLVDTSNGNVGIGTTSPGQKLSVAGTIESTSGGIKFPDGTTQTTAASGGTTLLHAVHVYSSSTTWTKPSYLVYARVMVWGGGGGGAAGNSGCDTGGGGGGGYAEAFPTGTTLTGVSTVTVTVGGAGAGGVWSGSGNGSAGGASSFGTYAAANGGGAGSYAGSGGAGGTATAGSFTLTAQNGVTTGCGNGTSVPFPKSPTAYGTGGSAANSGSGPGNAGIQGAVLVEEYTSQ